MLLVLPFVWFTTIVFFLVSLLLIIVGAHARVQCKRHRRKMGVKAPKRTRIGAMVALILGIVMMIFALYLVLITFGPLVIGIFDLLRKIIAAVANIFRHIFG